jgi:hypothetical protein
MKIERRIKFIHQTERKISFALHREPLRFFCHACEDQSEMLSINEAAQRTTKSWREIVYLIENGELHSTETESGEIYVCAASLSTIVRPKQS